ncbi:MAG: glycosyltransferase [Cyclobacteriaceae bacterium]
MLTGKAILIISPEPWDHIFVSKHHYAKHLAARGNKVYFLNPPSDQNRITPSRYENLSILDYSGFVNGLRFLPKTLRKPLIKRVWRKLEQMAGLRFDVIWSFDNSVFYEFDALPDNVLKISHIVDLNQDFMTERAARSADICFATTRQIKDRLSKFNPRTFQVTHGVNVPEVDALDVMLPGLNEFKVVYAGNLGMPYMDWEILNMAASRLKNVDFVFYGPGEGELDIYSSNQRASKDSFLGLENTYFPGKVDSAKLPAIYLASHVLLIAYQEVHHRDQANPHKMMEYLASGKPIVATYTAEYADLDFICMSKRNEDWPDLLQHTIENLDSENTPEKVTARKAFALNNTYDKQIDRIEEIISRVCK